MIRPRRASGVMRWSDVLQPVFTNVPVRPIIARKHAASQNERVTERRSSPEHATPSAEAIRTTGGSRDPIAPSESPAATAPTPSEVIKKPKPSEPSPSTLLAKSGTYTLKLNTQKLTVTWSPRRKRTEGVRAT